MRADGEPCYIRFDRHSLPMPRQTFLDMKTRVTAGVAAIESLGCLTKPLPVNASEVQYWINPRVQLLNGPVCTVWAVELSMPIEAGRFTFDVSRPAKLTALPGNGVFIQCDDTPLYPRRPTNVSVSKIGVIVNVERLSNCLTATLYAGSAAAVTRALSLEEFHKAPQSW